MAVKTSATVSRRQAIEDCAAHNWQAKSATAKKALKKLLKTVVTDFKRWGGFFK